MQCRFLLRFLSLLLFLGLGAAGFAADPPKPAAGHFAVLRPAFMKELQDAGVTIKDRKFEAEFLYFDGEFAVFIDPSNKDYWIYIPKNQILFLVAHPRKS